MTTEVRQATDVPCTLIDLKNEETVKGYRSGLLAWRFLSRRNER